MCSLFWQIRMENDQGDLADIVRASGGGGGGAGTTHNPPTDWQFPSEPINCQLGMEERTHNFGDPFSSMRDPLLHQLDIAGSGFFDNPNSTGVCKIHVEDNSSVSGSLVAQKILDDEMRPCNIFSRMLQISPNVKMPVSPSNISTMAASPRVIKTSSVANDMVRANSFAGCSAENGGVQISPPQNPVIKRRKHQAKKVVCIPAPAAANSRPSGEVVPSDLWAWRKYGQKPIKGSPYPRGYYRCSSSKGCSARKQVERSRADPNMLVITYTSEHNHPWPTQRNALAGSTRSQPTKNNPTSKNSLSPQTQKSSNLKEEHKETNLSAPVKDEMAEPEKSVVMDGVEFNQGYYQGYRPAPPDSNQPDDFFADLGEIEPDPLNLLFSNGFNGEKSDEEGERKVMDPFSLFDWVGNN